MLEFTVFHNDELVKTYESDTPSISIGRLPENEIPLASISISRRHAHIERDGANQYTISDLNSLNGILVNGKKIKKGPLSHGDKISIGKYSILFEVAPEDANPDETDTFNIPEEKANVQNAVENSEPNKTEEKEEDVEEIQVPETPADEKTVIPVLIDTNKHVVYKIDKNVMTLGSSEKDDIFVEGFLVSDGHVVIENDGKEILIHGKKPMGRFKINGKKVNKHKLVHKDQVEIGTSIFRYMKNGQK